VIRCLPFLLFVSFLTEVVAIAWNDSDIFVETVYRQVDSSGSTLDGATPYAFRASVRNTFSEQTQSLDIPVGSAYTPNPAFSFERVGAHHGDFK
jgi:hypothetical protein